MVGGGDTIEWLTIVDGSQLVAKGKTREREEVRGG